jgi:hypothetical protein
MISIRNHLVFVVAAFVSLAMSSAALSNYWNIVSKHNITQEKHVVLSERQNTAGEPLEHRISIFAGSRDGAGSFEDSIEYIRIVTGIIFG